MTRTRRTARRRRRHRITIHGVPSFTIDVGDGGFCTELLRVLAPGTPVKGSIRDDDGRDLPFAGRVAWARPGDPRLAVRGRMGVCFTQVAPESLDSLRRPLGAGAWAAASRRGDPSTGGGSAGAAGNRS